MVGAIVRHEGGREESVELSGGKKQQMWRESQNFLVHALMLQWKGDLVRAVTFFNIHHNKLYEVDGLDWKSFLEKAAISERSAQRYLRIGARAREMVKAASGASLLPHYITQRDFGLAFEPFFATGRSYTLRDLSKSSADLDTFRDYLDGKQIEDAQAIKLLNAKNKKPAEMIEREREQELREEKIEADIESEQSAFYRAEAAHRGYKWNDEDSRYENADGSKLSKKQLSEFVTAAEAMRAVKMMNEALANCRAILKQTIKGHGETFWNYRKHRADEAFNARVTEEFQYGKKLSTQIEELRAELFVGEEDED
jgi:hypothetical protein